MAHLGVAVFIIGVSLSEGMKTYYEGVNSTGIILRFPILMYISQK